MSELIVAHGSDRGFRWSLLSTVCAAALTSVPLLFQQAQAAEDSDRPTVWVELGGQLERIDRGVERYNPYFMPVFDQFNFVSPVAVQRPARYGVDGEAKIAFTPHGSDWTFSAAVRFGRSNGAKESHETPTPIPVTGHLGVSATRTWIPQSPGVFLTSRAKNRERHAVIDFQVGKDVGLGIWGGNSTMGLGVRMAQFTSSAEATIIGVPISHVTPQKLRPKYHHTYTGQIAETRSFQGVGPSLSWTGSTPIAGHEDSAELTFDWGATGALLFGRQKVKGETHATESYLCYGGFKAIFGTAGCKHGDVVKFGQYQSENKRSDTHNRSRSVVSPNIGGFAGVSMRYTNAKFSMGYRGDFYFGALDGGIENARRTTVGFHGPFATISLGLGG